MRIGEPLTVPDAGWTSVVEVVGGTRCRTGPPVDPSARAAAVPVDAATRGRTCPHSLAGMTTSRGRLAAGLLLTCALATGCGGGPEEEAQTFVLDDAFAAASEATSYRTSSYTAQDLSSSLMGVDTETEIDEDNPTTTAEVSPELSHITMDLSALLGPVAGGETDLGFEMWVTPQRITLDSRDYAVLKEADPSADLGPFEPGVSFFDLDGVAADDPEIVELMLGQGVTDLRQMATDLPDVLEDVERDGRTVTGTASYADVMAAMGGDVEQMSRSAAAGIALNLGVDVDELTDLYVDFYEATPADVTIELDEEDSLSSVEYTADLSDIYVSIFDRPEMFDPRPSDEELAQVEDLASDTEGVITVLQRFEVDDDLVVDPAPETDDDRTDQWVAFLENAGF